MTKLFKDTDHFYFIGIGGVSMSALGEILVQQGYTVSGSDAKESDLIQHLRSLGIHINIGHKKENITQDVTHIVFTAAISPENPELQIAKERNLPLINRAELLGTLMKEYEHSIAVSGTHGKTTTTSMVAEILLCAQTDPTITIGGILPTIGSNLKIGNSSYFVAEACEYFNSFLNLHPLVGIVLNIEEDHLDFFSSLAEIYNSFKHHALGIQKEGILVIQNEIEDLSSITDGLSCKVETFSLDSNSSANWIAKNIVYQENGHSIFDVYYNGKFQENIHLNIPGAYNVSNALGAIAGVNFLEIPSKDWANGLSHFIGTQRRFQRKGTKNGVLVIDDYAHHPTEIKATLEATKAMNSNTTWCVFQPHTYSRTKFLFDDFGDAFFDADEIIIADIFAAREVNDESIHSSMLVDRILQTGKSARYLGSFSEIVDFLKENCNEGDLLLTLGAGDVFKIGEQFLN